LYLRGQEVNGELAIVGAGSWGTALAIVLAPRFARIRLWVYERDLAAHMCATRENHLYLPGFRLPENVQVVDDVAPALANAAIVPSLMPAHVVRSVYGAMLPHLRPDMLFVTATKGLENGTLLRMSEVVREVVSARFEPRVAAISGPTFAREV